MIRLAFCIPGDINLPTGGYRYDLEVLKRLPAHNVSVEHVALGPGFPHPAKLEMEHALHILAGIDRRMVLLIDGLALGTLPPERVAALPHRVVALVHHPLGLEAGTPPERARLLLDNERQVLKHCRHIIVTSRMTERTLMADFGVPGGRISIAEPGVRQVQRATGSGKPCEILAVGSITPRKAFADLVSALAMIPDLEWRLTIAGSLVLAPTTVSALRDQIDAAGLGPRVRLVGAVNEAELEKFFAGADLFAMSSHYEGYGMALAEALAHGLPIVTTTGGAANETVPDAAALKVPAASPVALADALRKALSDPAMLRRMADASWAAGALLPGWDDTARAIADAIKEI